MPVGVPRAGDTKFEVLAAIATWKSPRKPPTVAEIRDTVGLSSRSAVQFHINHLVEDGYLDHVPGQRRTLKATMKGKNLVRFFQELDQM